MSQGARTIAELDRAVRTLQRRAREHAVELREVNVRLDAVANSRRTIYVGCPDCQASPAPSANSTPALPSGGSDLAGTARERARLFFSRVRMWAASLFGVTAGGEEIATPTPSVSNITNVAYGTRHESVKRYL